MILLSGKSSELRDCCFWTCKACESAPDTKRMRYVQRCALRRPTVKKYLEVVGAPKSNWPYTLFPKGECKRVTTRRELHKLLDL